MFLENYQYDDSPVKHTFPSDCMKFSPFNLKIHSKEQELSQFYGTIYPDAAQKSKELIANRSEEAEKAYRKAIELDPKDAIAHSGLADLLLKADNRNDEALGESIQGLTLDPDFHYARYIFKKACPSDNPAPWLRPLPSLLAHLKNHPQNEEVYQFALDGLIRLVNFGEQEAVQNLVEENQVQEAFEPLLLAVKARTDEKILETLAPERRTLVKEVVEKLTKRESRPGNE